LKSRLSLQAVRIHLAALWKSRPCSTFFVVNRWNSGYSGPLRRASCCNAPPLVGCDAAPECFLRTEALQCRREGLSWKSPLYTRTWGGIDNACRTGTKASFLIPHARTLKGRRVRRAHRNSTDCSVSRPFQPANGSSLLLIREGKLSTKPFDDKVLDSAHSSSFLPHYRSELWRQDDCRPSEARVFSANADSSYDPMGIRLSPWSNSVARRIFDCAWVLLALPVVAPLCLAIAAAWLRDTFCGGKVTA
jgi:hypothetical protein